MAVDCGRKVVVVDCSVVVAAGVPVVCDAS